MTIKNSNYLILILESYVCRILLPALSLSHPSSTPLSNTQISAIAWGGPAGHPPIILTGMFNLVSGHTLRSALQFNVFISV